MNNRNSIRLAVIAVLVSVVRVPSISADEKDFSKQATGQRITSLAVRIKTANELFAGPGDLPWINVAIKIGDDMYYSNNSYLDLGPVAFALGNGFRSGQETTISLPINKFPPLLDSDIVMIGLRKHGLLDLHNAPDNPGYILLPKNPAPNDCVNQLQGEVEKAQGRLKDARKGIELVQKEAQAQAEIIERTNRLISDLNGQVNSSKSALDKVAGELDAQKKKLDGIPKEIEERIQRMIRPPSIVRRSGLFGRFLGSTMAPAQFAVEVVRKKNQLWDQVNGVVEDLKKKKGEAESKLRELTSKLDQYLRDKTVAEKLKRDAEAGAQALLKATEKTLHEAEERLAQVRKLITDFPAPATLVPNPGEWKPERITLIVNGHDLCSFGVNERLRRGHTKWMKLLKPLTPEEQFVHWLRVVTPKEGDVLGQVIGEFTTRFKKEDISGWDDDMPVHKAKVTGILVHPPGPGTDMCASLDLRVNRIDVNGRTFAMNKAPDIRPTRYVRIEHWFAKGVKIDPRFSQWKPGDTIEAIGNVRFDTDRTGHMEIHPESFKDIRRVAEAGPRAKGRPK